MAYITLAQAKQTLGTDLYQSAYDDFTNPGTPSDDVVTEDINFVTGVIDSAIVQTYNSIAVPITGTEALAVLRGYAESLIKYQAYRRFDDAEIPAVVVDRYREVKDELQRLKDGLEVLPGQTQDPLADAISYSFNSADENSVSNSTVFKRSQMRGV
tara:strand:+ start:9861 stop:10328 length:468 start_codon:yes stop_codon:yes gene_type:complete